MPGLFHCSAVSQVMATEINKIISQTNNDFDQNASIFL